MSKKPTYKELEQKVKELEKAYDELEWQMEGRTGELMAINKQLHQEIIERQEVQEQLALFHQFVEASREGMGWADLDGCVRYINSTLCNMFGETKPEDSYGRPVLEYYSEETQRRLQEEIFPIVLREGTWTGELVIHSSTGSLIPTTNSLIVLRDAEGNPSSFANVLTDLTERKQAEDELRKHRDHLEEIVAERTSSMKQSNQKLQQEITERKKAEEALQDSEKLYRLLADNVSDVIWVRDMNLNLTYISPSVKDQQGYTVEEAMNRTPEEIWSPDSLKFIGEVLTEELEIEKQEKKDLARSRTLEVEVKCKDGSTIWTEAKMSFLRDKDSHPTGIIGVTRDISERKQIEEALRESESKFRNLFDLSPQAVALTEIKSGRLVDINNKFCELTKYHKEEIIGLSTTEAGFYLEADRSKFLKELQASGEVSGLDMKFKAKDHSILQAIMFARIIQIEGKSFILTIFYDITEQKRLEAQLQQAQKIEAIGTLAGGIAHDFNNLLMGIQGRTSLMLNDINLSHPHLEHLKGVEDYIKSATDLTRQLLGFAMGGKYEVKPADLNELVTRSSELFGRTKKEISIHKKIQEGLRTVEVDQGQIEQVLLNLYVNAWQSMPGGGELYLETENVLLGDRFVKPYELEPGKYVKISITDTGVGMDKATLERVFEPFFTTKEMGRGTGLGLASAYGIIKNHGGIIIVSSEKGKGATFNIYLPASEREVFKEKELSEDILKGAETILLVDDEKMILDVGKELLKKLGYKVLVAKGGKAAVELYEANNEEIDMVILDMIMPHMGGGDTYDLMKTINPNIKILLSSGYSIDGQATEIMKRGCNGFIQKPFDMKGLSQKIREIFDKK
ncbi:MAG: PAS domain S-box protein [Desulfobacterales bacterium]|uniref:histidine kinase n=1 Tax=Candidatus Desulfatibia vada TaxID=2841696 RepID=A0A8J6P0Z0_9BACT|nr:PAS domain S-box protein [Candidatus Desulfatibia vada]MBL6971119.1 PAS domain S-box protein [Desulfobacterales bacterium]